MADINGLPYWTVRFDEQGDPDPELRRTLLAELPAAGLSDLFVFAHGWNNAPATADGLYRRFFGLVGQQLQQLPRRAGGVGVVGVVWPSMRWLDEPIPDFAPAAAGGAASATAPSDADLVTALKAVFTNPAEQAALDRMAALLEQQPDDPRRVAEFQELMSTLDETRQQPVPYEDSGELHLVQDSAVEISQQMAAATTAATAADDGGGAASIGLPAAGPVVTDDGGAAGLGALGSRIWQGAKEALRGFTYFQMKNRAGIVGEHGLGPLCTAVQAAWPQARIHLIGHSFGARLVSFALKGLAGDQQPSPVKSVVLLQGAFSHFAFARSLPFRPSDGGALFRYAGRVDGPIVVVHSVHDSAVGTLYPMASMASGEDAAGIDAIMYRWGAMGHDGAQVVDAATFTLGGTGWPSTVPGTFINVNADAIVRAGGPPAGAHSDIFHPELARLALTTAGLATPG